MQEGSLATLKLITISQTGQNLLNLLSQLKLKPKYAVRLLVKVFLVTLLSCVTYMTCLKDKRQPLRNELSTANFMVPTCICLLILLPKILISI